MRKLTSTQQAQNVTENVMASALMLQNARGYIEAQIARDPDAAKELRTLASDLFELLTVMVDDEQRIRNSDTGR